MSIFQVVQHEPKSLEWWLDQHRAGRLDPNPKFQRRAGLWSRYKQAHLIDSVINGYDIPKFYVADFTMGKSTLNTKDKPYAIVDGKQRFEAFFEFLEGGLSLNASSIYESDNEITIKNLTFEELKRQHPSLASKVLNYRPVVMSIVTDDRDRISEMFVRLNSGEAINSAERRNAQPGPIPELVREIVQHAFFRNRVSFNTRRMADHQLAMKLLMIEHANGPVDTKATNMDRFVKGAAAQTVSSAYEPPTDAQEAALKRYEKTKDRVISVLELLAEAFRTRDPLLSTSGRIPIYYLAVREFPALVDNLRDFVEEFEERVKTAMRKARDQTGPADPRLLNYYTLSRSANDQQSIRSRYEFFLAEARVKRLI